MCISEVVLFALFIIIQTCGCLDIAWLGNHHFWEDGTTVLQLNPLLPWESFRAVPCEFPTHTILTHLSQSFLLSASTQTYWLKALLSAFTAHLLPITIVVTMVTANNSLLLIDILHFLVFPHISLLLFKYFLYRNSISFAISLILSVQLRDINCSQSCAAIFAQLSKPLITLNKRIFFAKKIFIYLFFWLTIHTIYPDL